MNPRIFIAGVLMVLSLSIPAVAKVTVDREGASMANTTSADLMRHPEKDKFYSESWTTILQSDDGYILYINFMYTNIGVIEGRAGVNMSITPPDKPAKHFGFEHDVSTYSENEAQGLIKIGPNKLINKGKSLTVNINEKGLSLNLKMDGWHNGVKFYDGKMYLNEKRTEYAQHFFHMPRGDFEAELTFDGKTIKLKGAGYMDHMLGNRLTSDYSKRWWTTRLFTPEYTLAFINFQMDPKRGGEVISRAFFGSRDKILAVSDNLKVNPASLVPDPKASHKYHAKFDISLKNKNVSITGTLQSKRLHDREAVIEELPKVQQGIAKMFAGNPVVYRMEGNAELKVTEGENPEKTVPGVALMETIVLAD